MFVNATACRMQDTAFCSASGVLVVGDGGGEDAKEGGEDKEPENG